VTKHTGVVLSKEVYSSFSKSETVLCCHVVLDGMMCTQLTCDHSVHCDTISCHLVGHLLCMQLCCGLVLQDLLRLVLEQRSQLLARDTYVRDLEDYIDNLLVKVMETHPRILQNPYIRPTNNCSNNSSMQHGLPASAYLPPGVYVANQLNKSTAASDETQSVSSKVKSKKGKGKQIELLHIFSRLS